MLSADLIAFFGLLKTCYDQQDEDGYRSFVRKWSDTECFYEQAVRTLGSRFAHDAIFKDKEVANTAVRHALADIVRATSLNELIDYDEDTGKMPWKDCIPNEVKSEIARLVVSSTSPVMPSYDMNEIRKEIN